MKCEYLAVLAATVLFPLFLSSDKNLPLMSKKTTLAKTILWVSIPFWCWDAAATARGHWFFNGNYVLGLTFLGMPAEEWLFFPVVVFVSIFVWESVKYFFRRTR